MGRIVFLSRSQIETLHAKQLKLYGGIEGILDENLLESAIYCPMTVLFGEFVYKTIHLMAAAYFFSLSKNHAFLEGNKRTAVMTVFVFYELNGYELDMAEEELEGLAEKVVTTDMTREEIAEVLERSVKQKAESISQS